MLPSGNITQLWGKIFQCWPQHRQYLYNVNCTCNGNSCRINIHLSSVMQEVHRGSHTVVEWNWIRELRCHTITTQWTNRQTLNVTTNITAAVHTVPALQMQIPCCYCVKMFYHSFLSSSYANFTPNFALASPLWKQVQSAWNFKTTSRTVLVHGWFFHNLTYCKKLKP